MPVFDRLPSGLSTRGSPRVFIESPTRRQIVRRVYCRWIVFTTTTGTIALLTAAVLRRPWLDDYQVAEGESSAAIWLVTGFVAGLLAGAIFGVITGGVLSLILLNASTLGANRLRQIVRIFAGIVFGFIAVIVSWLLVKAGDPLFTVLPLTSVAVLNYASSIVVNWHGVEHDLRRSRSRSQGRSR
jgi:hypothetical protein